MGLTKVTLAEDDRTRKEKREVILYSVMIRQRESLCVFVSVCVCVCVCV